MTSRDAQASYYDLELPDGTRTEVWSVLRAVLSPEQALGYAKGCLLTRIMRDGRKDVDRMREAEKVGFEAGMLREAMEAYLATPRAIAVTVSCDDPATRIAELERERDSARMELGKARAALKDKHDEIVAAWRQVESEGARDEGRTLAQCIANMRAALETERQAAVAMTDELERVREAVRWALGESGEFRLRGEKEGAYWWRPELRRRAFPQPPAPKGE